MSRIRANYDEPWKEALTEYFEQFLLFFFPGIHQLIDWGKTHQSSIKNCKELQVVYQKRKGALQINYRCKSSWLVSGEEICVDSH
ncbi:hypothetical protein U9R62_06535 [Cylindrospermopsis raciborskii DSH]|uniref:hypothetical protein n=1 Tax=Cylindrospermopsis raciborskii TaxID=77022 RepID=UPI002ED87A3E